MRLRAARKTSGLSRAWLLILCAAGLIAARPHGRRARPPALSAMQIVERALAAHRASARALEHYAWQERDRSYRLNDAGKIIKTLSDVTHQVNPFHGVHLSFPIAINGKPLNAQQQASLARAKAKFFKQLTPARLARIRQGVQHAQNQLQKLEAAIPQAFELRLAGERSEGGRQVYIVQATPNPGYRAPNDNLRMLRHLAGTLWIDRRTFALARARVHVLQAISFDWGLGQLEAGSRIVYSRAPVDKYWFPQSLTLKLTIRKFYLEHLHRENLQDYFNYARARGTR